MRRNTLQWRLANEQPTSKSGKLTPNTAVKPETPPFDEFNSESEGVKRYFDRHQEYFVAYDINNDSDNAAKRTAILLTSIGSAAHQVYLNDLSYPDAQNLCPATITTPFA